MAEQKPLPNPRKRKTIGRRVRASVLMLADFVGINVAFAAAYWLRYRAEVGGPIEWYNDVPYSEYVPWGLGLALILVVAYWLQGLYTRRRTLSWLGTMYAIGGATIVGVALLTIAIFGLRPEAQSRLMLPYAFLLIMVVIGIVRLFDVAIARRRLRHGKGTLRTLVVGAGEMGRTVMRNIVAQPYLGYQIVGFVDDDPDKRAQAIGRFEPLGEIAGMSEVLADERIDMVIVSLPWRSREKIVRLVDLCEDADVMVRIVPDLFQMSLNRVDQDSLHGVPLIAVREPAIRGLDYRVKRAMDVVIAATAIVVFAPVAALIAIAIKAETPGPVHFRQTRIGRRGKPFTCYKFRSMVEGAIDTQGELDDLNEATGPLFKMRSDPRLTRAGRFLRRASLDELPQLWNVLRGEMSLVGPRPPVPREVVEYKAWHRRRLDVSPGMTGLWQVSGRSELTFDEMVMLDLYYAENWSLVLDLSIMLRTVPTVLMGTGAY